MEAFDPDMYASAVSDRVYLKIFYAYILNIFQSKEIASKCIFDSCHIKNALESIDLCGARNIATFLSMTRISCTLFSSRITS